MDVATPADVTPAISPNPGLLRASAVLQDTGVGINEIFGPP
jgi:hypothetical protein